MNVTLRLGLALFCFLLVAARPGGAQSSAPTPMGSVVAVEHSVPFGTVQGRLLLLGNYVVFVDEQQPAASFVVAKSVIESLNAEGPAITIQTTEGIRNRSGEVKRLSFRVASGGDPAVVTSWYGGGMASTGASSSPAAPGGTSASAPGIFQARHQHRFGECRGRLIIGPDQLSYESVSSVGHSRRWEYQAIKETKLSNPYELEIKPFSGDSYKLQFDGTGMDPAAYRVLVDRVTSARGNR
jgi:hypothetical protein